MVIVTRKKLEEAAEAYMDAAKELRAWQAIVETVRWRDFVGVQQTFPDADAVDGYIVFNFRHNRYRLITVVHYAKDLADRTTQGHVYVRSFLTHREYDQPIKWDPYRS